MTDTRTTEPLVVARMRLLLDVYDYLTTLALAGSGDPEQLAPAEGLAQRVRVEMLTFVEEQERTADLREFMAGAER